MSDEYLVCNDCGGIFTSDEAICRETKDEYGFTFERVYECPFCDSADTAYDETDVCKICDERKVASDMSLYATGVCSECIRNIKEKAVSALKKEFSRDELDALGEYWDLEDF